MTLEPATSRRANLLFVAALVMELSRGIAIVAIPLFAIRMGADSFQLGTLGLCQRLPYVVLCFVFGSLSDRVGRKALVVTASVGLIGVYCVYPAARHLWHLFALVPVGALCVSLFWPPVQAWVSELPTASLGSRTSLFNMAWSVGSTVGCVIGGMLSEGGARHPFYVCAALSATLLLVVLATPARRRADSVAAPAPAPSLHPEQHPLNDVFLHASWVANFAAFASGGIIFFIFPKLAKSLSFSNTAIGALLFVSGLSRTATFFTLGRGEQWWYRLSRHVAAQIVGAAGIAAVGFLTQWAHIAVAFALVGYMCGTCYGASLVYSLRSGRGVGKRAGLHEGILVSGSMVGAFLGGLCAKHLGERSPYLLAMGLILIAALVQTVMVQRARRRLALSDAG